MQLPLALLGLPTSLLVLLAAQLQAQQLPTAIKKMSLDEGEKILPYHLAFAPQLPLFQSPLQPRGLLNPDEELLIPANSSATLTFRPPFALHRGEIRDANREPALFRRAKEALDRLQGRQFACPTNTESCESIGEPDYCCVVGETCFKVEDAPETGNVGCCPEGSTCSGSVGTCQNGSTSCSADVGGGCCVPGYICAQVGCVASSVSVITQTTTSTAVISNGSPSTVVTTVIITITPIVQTTTSTVTQTSTANIPSSTNTATETITTTGSAVPPYRPTSGSEAGGTTTSAPSTTNSADVCPTGFYACLATAGAGCCRTGRDCMTTSCPPISSTTIISNGATIVVPASDGPDTTATSTCADGWFLCPTEAGPVAGCCPSGYGCGTASCTLSAATVTATVQKELPSSASVVGRTRGGSGGKWAVFVGLTASIAVLAL